MAAEAADGGADDWTTSRDDEEATAGERRDAASGEQEGSQLADGRRWRTLAP